MNIDIDHGGIQIIGIETSSDFDSKCQSFNLFAEKLVNMADSATMDLAYWLLWLRIIIL